MPLIDRIPMPSLPGESFESGAKTGSSLIESMFKNQLNPYQIELLKAQAQESKGKASQSQMFSNLIRMAMGEDINQSQQQSQNLYQNQPPGQNYFSDNPAINEAANSNPGYQLTENDKQGINNLQPGESYRIPENQESDKKQQSPSNMQNQSPRQKIAMDWLQRFGHINPTVEEKSDIETKAAFNREMSSSDVKQNAKINEAIFSNEEITPVLEDIQKITANPEFQSMYKNPQYLGYDIKYLKKFGTPEQIKLLSSFGANTKSLYSHMSADFKGAFRDFERKIFDKAIPNEETDTLPAMQAKVNTLLQLRSLMTQRLKLADQIFRSSKGAISQSSALQIAAKQIGSDKVAKEISDQYDKFEKEQSGLKKETKGSDNQVRKWKVVDGQLVEDK
jgi:hypothetical protein